MCAAPRSSHSVFSRFARASGSASAADGWRFIQDSWEGIFQSGTSGYALNYPPGRPWG